MTFKRHIVISAALCTSASFLGCGTLGTYYPRTSARPVTLSSADLVESRKAATSKKLTKQKTEIPENTVAAHRDESEPQAETPPVEFTFEVLPVEFEEEPVGEQPPSYDGESHALPLPEPAADVAPLPATSMTLEQLESLALQNNPSIKALVASTQKAAGFRTQVGAKSNPLVGYQAQQLADQGTDQHLLFIEREFITGGKRELNRCVLNATLSAQLQELEAQRMRVTTDIRIRYYQALAIQRQLELINEFSLVADKGLKIAELRMEAGEGSRVDVLQASIQKNEVSLAQQQAHAKLSAIWREISALAGVPSLPGTTLEGTLPTITPERDWEQLASTLVMSSPEYAAAQVRISRANASLQRHLQQPLPNVAVQVGAGVDNSTNSGMLNLQFGVPLPVNNGNEGNIAAARAEVRRAHMDAQRIENNIEARLAVVSREYDTAVAAVNQYATNILPSANESMQLAEQAYEAGESEFVQILIARKTYFDSNLQYVNAQSQLAIAQAQIDGFVLTGALNSINDDSGDDSLRGLTFGQQ